MEFQDVVRARRMVRSFVRRGLPPEAVERILRNAQRAPSAGFSQGWAFLVFEGQAQTQQYWDTVGPDDRDGFSWQDLFSAPLLIVCLSNKSAYLDRYAEPDKGWTDRSESHWPKIDLLRSAFGVPAELHPIGTVAVGYAKANDPPSPSLKRGHRPTAEVIHRGRW